MLRGENDEIGFLASLIFLRLFFFNDTATTDIYTLSLHDALPIWVDFPVPEGSVAKFAIGSKIELTADAYPGQLFKGEVEAFDAKLNQDARMLMVRARVPNPDRKLLPGMFANVAVLAGGAKEFVTVPRTAVT